MAGRVKTEGGETRSISVTINGSTTSAAFEVPGILVGLAVPASVAGASMTFEVSDSIAGTFQELRLTSDTALTVTMTASKTYILEPSLFACARYVKLVSAASETSKTFTVFYRPVA